MRGLKLFELFIENRGLVSHLLQMRGLKLEAFVTLDGSPWSHLLQMRGLKLVIKSYTRQVKVASFTDAWIETL